MSAHIESAARPPATLHGRDARATTAPIAIAIFVLTFAVYSRVSSNAFIEYDDPGYVRDNARVQQGLTADNIAWAFTTGEMANWHPLTWLSLMLDTTLWGASAPLPKSAPHAVHLTNVVLHAAAASLLFVWLCNLTAMTGRSAIVAALFALHPAHVESVAWAAERKDVLAGLLFVVTLISYSHYARRPGAWRMAWVCVAYVLALLAKPTVVTLPFVLLLLDYWPLRRLTRRWNLVIEKLPLMALGVAASITTFFVQRAGGAMAEAERVTRGEQVGDVVVAYVAYLGKLLWPARLAVFYPEPEAGFGALRTIASAAIIVLLTIAFARPGIRRRAPYLLVGWLWFLGMLVPMIGVVRIGMHFIADRYTYLPSIGLFIAITWIVADATARSIVLRRSAQLIAIAVLALAAAMTWNQLGYWRDTETLFAHALAVTDDNWLAHSYVGAELVKRNRLDEAGDHYRTALRLRPQFAEAWYNSGNLAARRGRWDEAMAAYRAAIARRPNFAEAHYGLGACLAHFGDLDAAAGEFREAVRIKPELEAARRALAAVLAKMRSPAPLP